MLANLAKLASLAKVAILAKFGQGCRQNVSSERIFNTFWTYLIRPGFRQ